MRKVHNIMNNEFEKENTVNNEEVESAEIDVSQYGHQLTILLPLYMRSFS